MPRFLLTGVQNVGECNHVPEGLRVCNNARDNVWAETLILTCLKSDDPADRMYLTRVLPMNQAKKRGSATIGRYSRYIGLTTALRLQV